jgi:hypothetical protein
MLIKVKNLLKYDIPFLEFEPEDSFNSKSSYVKLDFIHPYLEVSNKYDSYNYDVDKLSLKDSERFDFKRIYDKEHGSDEESYLYLVFLDGELLSTFYKEGDNYDFNVDFFSLNSYNNFLEILATMENETIKEEILDLDYEIELNNNYNSVFDIDGSLYHNVSSAKWCMGFLRYKNPFLLEEGTKLTPCEMVKFSNDLPSWKNDESVNKIIIKVGGEEKEVDSRLILFKS